MKKLLLTLVVLLGAMSAAFAQVQTMSTNKFWPNNSAYTNSNTSTGENKFLDSYWTTFGFNNNNYNGWTNIRCGRKNNASTAYITNVSAIKDGVSQFVVNSTFEKPADKGNLTEVNLYVSSEKTFEETSTTKVVLEDFSSDGDWTFEIPAEAQGENKFYKFEFVCASASNNGFLGVNSITSYPMEGDVKSVNITYNLNGAVATVSLDCETEGATIYYGFAEDAITNEYTKPFEVNENCTVYAFSKKDETESVVKYLAIEVPYTSFKEAIANGSNNDNITIVVDSEVLYQNGSYLMLTDGTSNIMLYNTAKEYEVGTKISYLTGSVTIYNDKLFEVVDAELTEGGNGATYTVNEITTLADLTEDNLFDKVVIKGCNISGKSGNSATLSLGGETMPIWNVFGIDFENGTNYDVTCFIWKSTAKSGNGELQIAPIEVVGGEFKETVKTPVITPNARELHEGDKVTISCATEGATIYYTTDGTEPSNSSKLYSAPFEINFGDDQERTVKAIAYKDDMLESEIASKEYHFFDPTCNIITADNHEGKGNSYEAHTCTIDGVAYAMNAIHNSTQGIQMNNSTTRLNYLIQTGDNEGLVVKSIEVDYHGTSSKVSFTVRGSNVPFSDSEENNNIKTNGVEIGTISIENPSVEFTKDYNYFAFYPATTGVVYLNSITIYYREPAPVAAAPVLGDELEDDFESDETALLLPVLPQHEDWTPMYQVNDGEILVADEEGTVHEEALDGATLHTIKIWYEHYNLVDKSDVKTYTHLTAPIYEVKAAGTEEDPMVCVEFTTIGDGVTVYFTLDGTVPTPASAASAKARATSKDGGYHIEEAADLSKTHAVTSANKAVYIHSLNDVEKVSLSTIAVHESGKSSSVTKQEVTTGLENIAVEEAEAVYYNLQGVRVENPAAGVYVRVAGGKATKVMFK